MSELRKVARGWRWGRPAPKPHARVATDAEFDTDWSRTPGWNTARAVLQEAVLLPAVRALASPRVRGLERLRTVPQPAVIAANHVSHLDTSVLIAAMPPGWRHKLTVGAAADYFFKDKVRGNAAALAMGAFPVERTRASATSAKLALRLLEEGWNLILFPEGGRSDDGWLQELKPGAAFIAARTGRPLVPVWLTGTEHLLPKGTNRPRRGRVDVLIGDALYPAEGESPRALHARLEEALSRLAIEASADWWTSLRKPAEGLTGPDAARWRRVWARGTSPPRASSDWR